MVMYSLTDAGTLLLPAVLGDAAGVGA
jgi:hypothetical protein